MTTPLTRPALLVASLILLALATAEPARAQAPAFNCRAEETLGIPEADAATVVSIVCAELGRVSQGQGGYAVSIRPLGKAFIVSVRDLATGNTRTLTLTGLEETPTAAERLAEATVLGERIEKTQRVDNLLAEETRQPHEKKGSRKFMLGVTGVSAAGESGSGVTFGIGHEGPQWALLGDLRFAISDIDLEPRLSLSAIGAGVRRYLSPRDFAPFVGAGLESLSIIHARNDGRMLAPYAEVGVQAMRLSRARVAFTIRAHVPTSSIDGQHYDWQGCDAYDYGCAVVRTSEYVLPLTFDLTLSL